MAKLNPILLAVGLSLDALVLLVVVGDWKNLGRIGNGDQTIYILAAVLGSALAATGYLGLLIGKSSGDTDA